ncbi:alpha/beta hydrolase [Acidiphilium iwatense]|uniref:Alpha/beta hydrolase n=1 Tax=Acidiphilium iwatense TaxID=768198 RepID=A0ABS9DVE0_9PROT|nr:alpha/beta hydrolase [Acidiphilium iwatense]MCF3946703.1 alpha/beta hydrolase [Acidiphilium iwatense]
MASLAAHLLNPVLRFQVKRRLARATEARELRRAFNASLPGPRGVRFTAAVVGIAGEWAEPAAGASPALTLLYLHGGAYIACSSRSHRPITGGFARRGVRVFAPDYRLAPENPYPAALEDGLATYQALLDQGTAPERLAIAGDSAGGGLALAVLLKAKQEGLPMPARAVLFSPWTDLAATGASTVENDKRDPMIKGSKVAEGAEIYLAGADPREPFASPLYGDLAGLPPLMIHVGDNEVLRDDSVRFDATARAAGVTSLLRVWPVVAHVWPMFNAILPEGRQTLDESAAFIRGAVGAAR